MTILAMSAVLMLTAALIVLLEPSAGEYVGRYLISHAAALKAAKRVYHSLKSR